MANRNWASGGKIYSMHVKPVLLDCNFVVDSTNANGLGIKLLKGPAIQNVFMHTSQTPGAGNRNPSSPNVAVINPNPQAGSIVIQLQDNYNRYLSGFRSIVSPLSGSSLKIDNSALVAGAPYVITIVGNASAAKWKAMGVPAGVTPAVGVSFIAASNGGSVNTSSSRVQAPANSAIGSIELIGDSNLSIAPSLSKNQGFGAQFIMQCLGQGLIPGAAAASNTILTALADAAGYAVLAATAITNTGSSIINGNVGEAAGNTFTGFPPGVVIGGAIGAGNSAAEIAAQVALINAINAGQALTTTQDLSGQDLGSVGPLLAGVYEFTSSAGLTGSLILDGNNNSSSIFVFKIGSTLTTAAASRMVLINGASAANVYFIVGSSATLGTTSVMAGNILAATSITFTTGASLNGRAQANTGAVTLDSNSISLPIAASLAAQVVAAPADGTLISFSFLLSDSSILIQGE